MISCEVKETTTQRICSARPSSSFKRHVFMSKPWNRRLLEDEARVSPPAAKTGLHRDPLVVRIYSAVFWPDMEGIISNSGSFMAEPYYEKHLRSTNNCLGEELFAYCDQDLLHFFIISLCIASIYLPKNGLHNGITTEAREIY